MNDGPRSIKLVPATDIVDDVPVWVWEHGGKGRIQLGTLALFAGRPGAGKSTAARWFASQLSTGSLPGCWLGEPQNIAYIAPAEESLKYIVKPGLRAAGADMTKIFFPEVRCGTKEVRLLSVTDEEELTRQFTEKKITVVIIDPLMDTIGAGVDIHRNNEVRAVIEPWARIADQIDGISQGVVHLNKGQSGDVVAAINGSSAFGEVARAVFGFAKDDQSEAGDRIMSQEKNSTGEEDLALLYRIEPCDVATDSGKTAEVGKFVIHGDSDRSVGDVLRGSTATNTTEAQKWVEQYLVEHGRVPSSTVKERGGLAGLSPSSIDRAARKLGVNMVGEGFPRVTWWSLPRSRQQADPRAASDATDTTDATDVVVAPVASSTSPPRTMVQSDATGTCGECGAPRGSTGKCVPCILKRHTPTINREGGSPANLLTA